MSAPVIAFLGTGSMNGSILDGVLAGGADPSAVRATTRSAASAQRLAAEHPEITVPVSYTHLTLPTTPYV